MKQIDKIKEIVLGEHHNFLNLLHNANEITWIEFEEDVKSSMEKMEDINTIDGILSFMHFEMGYDSKDSERGLINILASNMFKGL